ncbi:MAG TPA: hypothetical protein PLD40_02520 [Kiritimatiellia bacterium]|jgi:hypothetical protein|nr:hypothetical protein [Kiritimatiellia bacterium]HOE37427.1 hypothetical protein [Kiritimatiellia bacterium]HOR74852.1 hypothetical protein [Kiritimatiellia bacterium]HOU58895.1 hypothetical protein [Kiritimatiellia bacterium]HPK69561.1 hypothetical protein [Kiritimatiellia bacterium]
MPDFSTAWKNTLKVVPLCGKSAESFSIAWNFWASFFHSMERIYPIFPRCGKSYETQAAHRVRLSYCIVIGLNLQFGRDYKNQSANSPACRATARTAWKLSLQKAETADDAKVQTVAGGGDPGSGLNEPSYKNSQQP